ncbi:hypothetical protein fugu_015246 [Takifugu bimaculatus]|uniref:Uncharacterized protein n=1 Tax=Takifugu bimaculatus TaxID=433685 RepID=A0A4Z2C062_9TELE|nr:hypothetical protein fugu_015246 [Takifugu bimaculatus]
MENGKMSCAVTYQKTNGLLLWTVCCHGDKKNVATGPTVEVVVLIRATVSLAATARRSMEATTRALTATLAHITREDTAATAKPSQVDTVLRRRIKEEEEEEVVATLIPASPIVLEPITTATATASPPA